MRRETYLSIIAIIIISFAICSNTFNSPFHYDDEKGIVKNESIRDARDIEKIFSSNPSRPVSTLSFALNFWWGKLNPFSYHLVNIILHSLNGVLFFLMLKIIFEGDILVPAFSSLIFVSHPVNTESVTYISGRPGILCTTFYFLSMIFFIKFLKNSTSAVSSRGKRSFFYLASVVFFLLSIGSKETGVTLPAILILCELCFSLYKTPKLLKSRKDYFMRYRLYYLPFIFLVGAVMLLRKYYYGTFGNPAFERDYYKNFITQADTFWAYIKLLAFPINLNIDHEVFLSGSFFELNTLLSLAGIFVLVLSALIICRKYPEITFSVFLFLITLSPTMLIPLQDILSERWLYLPKTGFCILAALSLKSIKLPKSSNPSPGIFRTSLVSGVIIIMFFSSLTLSRNYVWGSEVSLWADAVKKSPHKARTFNNLGVALAKIKRYDEAIKAFKEAGNIDKHYSPSIANLAKAYRARGESELMLEAAVDLYESGNYYFKKGMIKEAIISYRELIGLVPNSVAAYGNLGMLYMSLNEIKLARECFEKVLVYNPENEAAKKFLKEMSEGK